MRAQKIKSRQGRFVGVYKINGTPTAANCGLVNVGDWAIAVDTTGGTNTYIVIMNGSSACKYHEVST